MARVYRSDFLRLEWVHHRIVMRLGQFENVPKKDRCSFNPSGVRILEVLERLLAGVGGGWSCSSPS